MKKHPTSDIEAQIIGEIVTDDLGFDAAFSFTQTDLDEISAQIRRMDGDE